MIDKELISVMGCCYQIWYRFVYGMLFITHNFQSERIIMTDRIKTALYLPNYGPFGEARNIADLARDAESAGWDGFFIWDHIVRDNVTLPFADPWVSLTAAAMQTTTIKLGTTVTPIPRRRPHVLAKETATLDRLSNGRLMLSVGIGGGKSEWEHLGEEEDLAIRGKMLDEGLDVLIGLWSGQPFQFVGEYFHIEQAHILPPPVQNPRIPIIVGGIWPNKRPFRRMACWDGMFPLFGSSNQELESVFAEALAYVKAERQQLGLDGPFDVLMRGVSPGDDSDEASARLRKAADAGATWWLEALTPDVFDLSPSDPEAFNVLRDRVLQGPPAME
jgi:alkanesulfonate monooxygenase SsuD/methylene tetrahydromethanopterin reductase-like flavin-dependent oxidoreductase (luciferase family)